MAILKMIGDFNDENSIFSYSHINAFGSVADRRFSCFGAKLL